jgi:glucose dehydrogenase
MATGNPADSFYGGDRKGANLYANCVLALHAATGKLLWHYQVVHHDIFDYDVPRAPALIEAVRDGRRIPAVAQITKMGSLFILDRMTGQPVFGVREVPVPADLLVPFKRFRAVQPLTCRLAKPRSSIWSR